MAAMGMPTMVSRWLFGAYSCSPSMRTLMTSSRFACLQGMGGAPGGMGGQMAGMGMGMGLGMGMGMGMGGMGGQLAGNSMGMGLVHPFLQAAQRLQQIPPKVTLYVEGVPNDATEREVYHLFRPFPGFISLRLRGAGNRMVSHLVNSHPLPATEQSSVSIRRTSPPQEAMQATGHHASSTASSFCENNQ